MSVNIEESEMLNEDGSLHTFDFRSKKPLEQVRYIAKVLDINLSIKVYMGANYAIGSIEGVSEGLTTKYVLKVIDLPNPLYDDLTPSERVINTLCEDFLTKLGL